MTRLDCFCEECFNEFLGELQKKEEVVEFNKAKLTYEKQFLLCPYCQNTCLIPQLEERNLNEIYDTYRKQLGLVDKTIIAEIIQVYHFSKEHLAAILGCQIEDIQSIEEGYLPSKRLSNLLKNCLNSPNFVKTQMSKALQYGRLPYVFYQAYLNNINDIQENQEKKLDTIVSKIKERCPHHDPKFLQKTLYYLQGFYLALMGQPLFQEDCQAWVHGPVYARIYAKQKWENCNQLHVTELNEFDAYFVQTLLKVLEKYDGDTLEDWSHQETPWFNMRQDLKVNEGSNRVISKSEIKSYFSSVLLEYGIFRVEDIVNYFDSRENNL